MHSDHSYNVVKASSNFNIIHIVSTYNDHKSMTATAAGIVPKVATVKSRFAGKCIVKLFPFFYGYVILF